MTTRVRKQHKPGRITFVGSGPGDPGLLTTRARNVLAHAALVFTDPDVPEAVLALIGTDLPPTSGPHPADAEPAAEAKTDDAAAPVFEGPETLTLQASTTADIERLTSTTGAVPVTGTGTIHDDGSQGGDDDRPRLSINDVVVNEGAGTATFTVTLTGSTGSARMSIPSSTSARASSALACPCTGRAGVSPKCMRRASSTKRAPPPRPDARFTRTIDGSRRCRRISSSTTGIGSATAWVRGYPAPLHVAIPTSCAPSRQRNSPWPWASTGGSQ